MLAMTVVAYQIVIGLCQRIMIFNKGFTWTDNQLIASYSMITHFTGLEITVYNLSLCVTLLPYLTLPGGFITCVGWYRQNRTQTLFWQRQPRVVVMQQLRPTWQHTLAALLLSNGRRLCSLVVPIRDGTTILRRDLSTRSAPTYMTKARLAALLLFVKFLLF